MCVSSVSNRTVLILGTSILFVTYGLIVTCLFVCVLIMCIVPVTMPDCLSMLFLVVTNFGDISISVLSTLSIKGRVILSDFRDHSY